jgi:solute:Na+ symporter, SSS family
VFLIVASFFFFTALVGLIAYLRTRREDLDASDGYFLAGRGLSGWVIGSSMLLTNLSAEHLVGLNGQAYAGNLTSMAWEATPVFATIVMALYFLPRYLRGAFTTLPEFFGQRYDAATRRLMSGLLLTFYTVVILPAACLYPGAVAVNQIFDLQTMFGVTAQQSLWISVWFIGLVGAAYAVFGGLKAVAVSDSINGIGLLAGGLLVPVFGLLVLGDGSLTEGLGVLVRSHPEKLNAIGGPDDPVPFGTIFTGMVLANLFYWGTNQAIIQRCLGAKSLAEAQKGVLLAGMFKIFVPLVMMVPGIIAFHLYSPTLERADHAYPVLVAHVLPPWMLGFFTAVLFGAVLSTYNSVLNSAATLFCHDLYKPCFRPEIDDRSLIRVGRRVTTIIAVFTMFAAPMVAYAPEGLFPFVRRSTGFFSIPMITLVLVGFFTRYTSGLAARLAVVFYLICYTTIVFILGEPINFIHTMGLLFLGMTAIMLAVSRFWPRAEPYTLNLDKRAVDLTPWKYGPLFATFLFSLLIFVYLLCSPIGLASPQGMGTTFAGSTGTLAAVTTLAMAVLLLRARMSRKQPATENSRSG